MVSPWGFFDKIVFHCSRYALSDSTIPNLACHSCESELRFTGRDCGARVWWAAHTWGCIILLVWKHAVAKKKGNSGTNSGATCALDSTMVQNHFTLIIWCHYVLLSKCWEQIEAQTLWEIRRDCTSFTISLVGLHCYVNICCLYQSLEFCLPRSGFLCSHFILFRTHYYTFIEDRFPFHLTCN